MPRERMRPGEWGKIKVRETGPGKFTAVTYIRDQDGKRREVERSGRSEEDARRNLLRELRSRSTPISSVALVTDKTTLSELFSAWLATKGKLKGQSATQYRRGWKRNAEEQIGALRIREFPTSRGEAHLNLITERSASAGKQLRTILVGMFGLAVRYDVIPVNPIRETETVKVRKADARAATPAEFAAIRAAIREFCDRPRRNGPKPGRLLPVVVEVLGSTGCRPNELLAARWFEVDLLADPPTLTLTGTIIDHGQAEDQDGNPLPVHRQDERKGGAPPHRLVLPKLAVAALTEMVGQSGEYGQVFANRNGGWMSLANLRRAMRDALPEELKWVTPYSFRRTVATVVTGELGLAEAQHQLSHARQSTTEQHYVERQTQGPDVRAVLDRFASGKVRD
ncbi:tyrosine-type recombinase/integrase [Nocardia sp. alder85J]|uniref:tyrosine-type recombinase/integrase n=1 Tax=Nocardia sp. alder85J TaxID=2862949 RepID=UPI001CD2B766|nr:site-specific integrase [Nocardia sp. alder85J]MCX4097612.1 site-specific integrase [Nocardia sp. alder85J]